MKKPKIVVTQPMDFSPEEIKNLQSLGEVTFYEDRPSPDEWLRRCQGADIICSGKDEGLKRNIHKLTNVFVSLPFVGVEFLDKKRARKRKIVVANSPGCNKEAVSEWIIAMLLNLLREFPSFMNVKELPEGKRPKMTWGLAGKKVCILGKGNIGSRVGKICLTLEMKVFYVQRGDNLLEKVKGADVIIDCLGANASTHRVLNARFFNFLKKGSYFITITGPKIYDVDALLQALDNGILAGAASDAANITPGNTRDHFYQKLLRHPRMLVTPHIAWNSDVERRNGNKMMIENIEAWLKGKPIHLIS